MLTSFVSLICDEPIWCISNLTFHCYRGNLLGVQHTCSQNVTMYTVDKRSYTQKFHQYSELQSTCRGTNIKDENDIILCVEDTVLSIAPKKRSSHSGCLHSSGLRWWPKRKHVVFLSDAPSVMQAYETNTLPTLTSDLGLVGLLVCFTSQQHASVSQGRICTDNFTCCHTEIEVADQTFDLTQSQCTDTKLTSPSTDPVMPGTWEGSH